MRLLVSFCVTRGHEKKPKADTWNVLGGLLLLFLVGFVVEFGLFGGLEEGEIRRRVCELIPNFSFHATTAGAQIALRVQGD